MKNWKFVRTGNIDPRIPAFKAKIPNLVKLGDVWHLKDIKKFSEDMVKGLKERKERLYKEAEDCKEAFDDWYHFDLSVEKAIDEAEKNK